jgi:hypothetical protein
MIETANLQIHRKQGPVSHRKLTIEAEGALLFSNMLAITQKLVVSPKDKFHEVYRFLLGIIETTATD